MFLWAVLACFDPQWPNLILAVVYFEMLGILPAMGKVRVIVKTISSRHQIYVDRNGEHTLYAVTDKLPEVKDMVLKAKRELGIARGVRALFRIKSEN
jgi:hypothetical protein